jgi:hypothetical protein
MVSVKRANIYRSSAKATTYPAWIHHIIGELIMFASWSYPRLSRVARWLGIVIVACWFVAPAYAGPFSGSITGVWSGPVILSGSLIDGLTQTGTSVDNSTTGACNLAGCPVVLAGNPADMVEWGTSATGTPPTSTVVFSGSNFTNQASNTSFTIGHFVYTNGNSDLSSLIFGANLTLTLKDTNNQVLDTKTLAIQIKTTSNTGSDLQNRDVVQFPAVFPVPGQLGSFFVSSLDVLEGATVPFDLLGEIVGDPTLELLQIVLAAGAEGGGFVGTGLDIPEPAGLTFLGIGLAGLLYARGRFGSAGVRGSV